MWHSFGSFGEGPIADGSTVADHVLRGWSCSEREIKDMVRRGIGDLLPKSAPLKNSPTKNQASNT